MFEKGENPNQAIIYQLQNDQKDLKSDYDYKEEQCTCNKSEEEVTDKSKEPEMLRSLDNIAESIAAIYKQLKRTALELQTTCNMLKEVIYKIDYRKEATLSEK